MAFVKTTNDGVFFSSHQKTAQVGLHLQHFFSKRGTTVRNSSWRCFAGRSQDFVSLLCKLKPNMVPIEANFVKLHTITVNLCFTDNVTNNFLLLL